MKGSPFQRNFGIGSPMKRDTGDALTKNIVNTNQKGDEEIRAKQDSKKKSKKVGPVESPESMKNKKTAYKDAMRAAGFDATKGERKRVFETYDDLQEAKTYKKHKE